MPDRRMMFFVALVVSCSAPQSGDARDKIEILDGQPVHHGKLRGEVSVEYDGNSILSVVKGDVEIKIDPKSPSVIASSADGSRLLLNYGDGSGQIYSLSSYNLNNGKETSLHKSVDRIASYYSAQPGCRIAPSEISFVFKGWDGSRKIIISVEDFSRRSGCDFSKFRWLIDLQTAEVHGPRPEPA